MIRRLTVSILPVVLGSVALLASFADVTFVMKNGERISGRFSYNHTDHYQLIVDGRERSYPSDDIAMIAFTAGDPSPREVSSLPASDNPPELERHTVVLRNGEMIRGKIYDFKGETLIMDIKAGDRRTYNFGDLARLYISASGARGVFRPEGAEQVLPAGGGARRGRPDPNVTASARVRVVGNVAWTDTRLQVNRGEQLRFSATGEVELAPGTTANPAGKAGAFPKEVYPVTGAAPGALIGRVGNGQPFLIGDKTDTIAMPGTGTLLLGVNDNIVTDNNGGFDVRIQRIGGQ